MLFHCWWECKLMQPLWKTVWRFLKEKLGIKPPYDPAIPLLGIYPEEIKTEKCTCIPLFIAALICITLIMSDAEYLFMCFLPFFFFFEKFLFRSFSHFLIALFVFLVLSCISCLYILAINPCQLFHLLLFSPILRVVISPSL